MRELIRVMDVIDTANWNDFNVKGVRVALGKFEGVLDFFLILKLFFINVL